MESSGRSRGSKIGKEETEGERSSGSRVRRVGSILGKYSCMVCNYRVTWEIVSLEEGSVRRKETASTVGHAPPW